ncbi:MAG TPA: glycosyltransferase family 4 protein [Bacteroidales bacterium]|nr:glycosyltransferase family 4 protein [Bacteroidales bacterium]
MKILLTTDNIGGVWTYTVNLAKGLKKNRIDVCIAVIGEKMSDSQKQELSFTSWYFIGSKQEWMQDPWSDIRKAGCLLLDIAAAYRPDIVHLNSYSFGNLGWRIPVIVASHSCVLSWWNAVKKEEAPADWNHYREMVGNGIRAADVVVAPGMTMMRYVEQYFDPKGIKVVIYNGADMSVFHPAPKKNFIFSMGRLWDEAKNVTLLLKAAGEIKYHIFIAGDLEEPHPYLPLNVHFLGRLTHPQVATWLSEAAVYALPVIYEPFGFTFLEAAFSECAIVTGDIESMREIWSDEAVFVNPSDSHALAKAINILMEDEQKRAGLVAAAKKKATADYTLDKMTSEYISLYNNVLQSSSQRKLKLQEL